MDNVRTLPLIEVIIPFPHNSSARARRSGQFVARLERAHAQTARSPGPVEASPHVPPTLRSRRRRTSLFILLDASKKQKSYPEFRHLFPSFFLTARNNASSGGDDFPGDGADRRRVVVASSALRRPERAESRGGGAAGAGADREIRTEPSIKLGRERNIWGFTAEGNGDSATPNLGNRRRRRTRPRPRRRALLSSVEPARMGRRREALFGLRRRGRRRFRRRLARR